MPHLLRLCLFLGDMSEAQVHRRGGDEVRRGAGGAGGPLATRCGQLTHTHSKVVHSHSFNHTNSQVVHSRVIQSLSLQGSSPSGNSITLPPG